MQYRQMPEEDRKLIITALRYRRLLVTGAESDECKRLADSIERSDFLITSTKNPTNDAARR